MPTPAIGFRVYALFSLGALAIILGNTRFGVPALAWLAPLSLLAGLRAAGEARVRLALVGTLLLAWVLATAKIVSGPVPFFIALGYGIPIALVHAPAYLLWRALVLRGRHGLAVGGFAALSALAEWAQAELTELGVWGALPTSQVGQGALLQLLAFVGMPGLSFVMHGAVASLEAWLAGRVATRTGLGLAGALCTALALGAVRSASQPPGPEHWVAAVRTDADFTGLPLPEETWRRTVTERLFARTAAAARAGAELVAWTEGSALVLPEEEAELRARAAASARALRVELVTAYIMPVQLSPLRYENRLRWYAPDGSERLAYLKHHPVPGEPAVRGQAPAPVLPTALGPASAALCYDYDFPALARSHAQGGAGLVVVPSSDWGGIDPIHTQMAAMRAIEGGFSILRATRWGLTAGIDARGELRAQTSTNVSAAPFTLVSLPVRAEPTPYARLGQAVLAPLLAVLAWALWGLCVARSCAPAFSPKSTRPLADPH